MRQLILTLCSLLVISGTVVAQEEKGDKKLDRFPAKQMPYQVENIELLDLNGDKTTIPMWGEKNLLIFYVDPDRHSQNHEFTVELEENHAAGGDNIFGFGILNLKDTWLPNNVIRSMARKRTEKNGALVISDPNRSLSQKWHLGDCNNKFVLLLISKSGEVVFCRKGELSEQDKKDFYEIIEKYR